MNTKYILKQILMLPVAALLAMTATSCGSESYDDVVLHDKVTSTDVSSNGYTIPATVSVTRDESSDTRTVYDPTVPDHPKSFEVGDAVLISGTTAENIDFAGVLEYSNGVFSGELSVNLPFASTAEELFKQATANNTIDVYLLAKGYQAQGWMSIVGEGATRKISFDQTKRFCRNLAIAVTTLSTEHATAYNNGFKLTPEYAIVDCTLKNLNARFIECDEVGITFNYKAGGTTSRLTTEMAPTDRFFFSLEGSPQGISMTNISVTVTGGNEFETLEIEDKSVVCGKIYTLNKIIHMPAMIMFPKTAVTMTYGNTPFMYPVLNTHDGKVVYSSSDTNVATVDANNSTVTIVAPGTTVITATVQNSEEYMYVVKEASYTLTVEKAPATIGFANAGTVEKKVGDEPFTNELTNTGDGAVTYTSSNASVATVDETGKVTVKADGSVTITATVTDGVYNSYAIKTASYTVVVGKKAGSISYAVTSVTKQIGDGAFTNELTKTGDGTVTYASSDTNVATVDANGKVTIKAAGSTSITATVADSKEYAYATKTASYKLTIGKKAGSISYAKSIVDRFVGDGAFTNPLTHTGNGTVTYTSSDTNVATVDASGKVTIKATGSTTITATVSDSEEYAYATKTASYGLVISRHEGSISYATTSISKMIDAAAFTNPLTFTGSGKVTYTSSNTSVATVDASGKVTIVGEGTTTITATVSDSEDYAYIKKTASYTLTVSKYAGSISYATTSIDKKIDAAAFTNELKNTGTGKVTYTSSNTNVATVDANGKVTIVGAGKITITATVADDATYTYATKTASYTVTITKYDGTISYEIVEVNKVSTDAPFINPLTKTGDGYPIYSSSDESIAKVNAETGEVTIVGLGYVNITATVGETGLYVYNPDHVTYRLLVIDASDVGAEFGYGSNNFDTAPWK